MKAHSGYIDTGVVWLYNTGSLVAQKNRSTTYHILMKSEKKKKNSADSYPYAYIMVLYYRFKETEKKKNRSKEKGEENIMKRLSLQYDKKL